MRAPRGFKFDEFDVLCGELDGEQLQLKWQHYTRALSAASTSTAVATIAAAPTGGVSMIGAMIAGPLIHNARKKRQIVEHHMSIRGLAPETRNKDIYGPMAFSAVLGGATMGVGSAGAELLAVDTATKVMSHAAIDAGVTAVEDKHSQREHEKEMEKAAAQIVRANTVPTSLGLPVNPRAGQVLVKHANTMPATLGSTANGLIASAARLKAEKYPLLKEYLLSVVHSRRYMSKDMPKDGGSREPLFMTGAVGDHEPDPSSSASLATLQGTAPVAELENNTAFVAELEDTSPYSATFTREPVELDSTPLSVPSDTCSHSGISPLSQTSTVSHWPSPHPSLVSELEDTSSPGSATSPASSWPSELPADADTIMSSLLDTIDELTLGELEADLECAIAEMDSPDACVEPAEGEAGLTVAAAAAAATSSKSPTNRMSRTFELPSDLDSLVRRHSTRFSRRASQRVSFGRSSSVYSQDSPAAILRKPVSQATLLPTTAESTFPPDEKIPDVDERHIAKSLDALMVASIEKGPYYDGSPLPPYSETDNNNTASASSACVGNPNHGMASPSASVRGRQAEAWVDEKRRSVDPVVHTRHPSLRAKPSASSSKVPFSPDDVYGSPTGGWIVAEPEEVAGGEASSSSLQPRKQQQQQQQQQQQIQILGEGESSSSSSQEAAMMMTPHRQESSTSLSSTRSKAGSMALSAHEGMKKVGYLGLEPATKIAIGASLMMVGVRPSVQRKYLDKAKGKMGMEVKSGGGVFGMGKW
ncbi:hypothetical protein diail_6537 [Diaporthe ilicicola]|nr:hypothetical protein diail_6537 [Diaporthe ilicicola]